jgi:hypothetical protein
VAWTVIDFDHVSMETGKMGRCWIVPLLVFSLLLHGCAHQQPAERAENAASPETSSEDDRGDTLRRFSQPSVGETVSNATVATGAVVAGSIVLAGLGVLFVVLLAAVFLAKGSIGPGDWH